MLNELIDEYTAILDKDPMDQTETTDNILRTFANKVIQNYLKETISDLNQSSYYKKQHNLWID